MRWTAALALVVVIAGASLTATIFVPAEFREIVADAGLIVRGRVTDVRPIAVPGTGVESIVTVGVETVLKGAANGFVSLRVPGGELGGYRHVMLGAPVLRPGERAVFFLRRGSDSLWRPVGLSMGVYPVHNDPRTGQGLVRPPIVAGRTASLGPIVRGDTRRKNLAIQEFESLIQLIIAGRVGQAVPRGGRQ
jgi:hypothetical protein